MLFTHVAQRAPISVEVVRLFFKPFVPVDTLLSSHGPFSRVTRRQPEGESGHQGKNLQHRRRRGTPLPQRNAKAALDEKTPIVVTGVAGFIGSHCAERCLSEARPSLVLTKLMIITMSK